MLDGEKRAAASARGRGRSHLSCGDESGASCLPLHVNKKAIRALGVAESFSPSDRLSTLAGVVMRADRIIDGFVFSTATVGGDDATEKILRMYRRLKRDDVNLIMLSGAIISLYNIVDVDRLAEKAGLPVVCLTYRESTGIESAIRHHFDDGEEKVARYKELHERERVDLMTGQRVFVRRAAISSDETRKVLDAFTLQGSVPEPVRVARLLARAVRR